MPDRLELLKAARRAMIDYRNELEYKRLMNLAKKADDIIAAINQCAELRTERRRLLKEMAESDGALLDPDDNQEDK